MRRAMSPAREDSSATGNNPTEMTYVMIILTI